MEVPVFLHNRKVDFEYFSSFFVWDEWLSMEEKIANYLIRKFGLEKELEKEYCSKCFCAFSEARKQIYEITKKIGGNYALFFNGDRWQNIFEQLLIDGKTLKDTLPQMDLIVLRLSELNAPYLKLMLNDVDINVGMIRDDWWKENINKSNFEEIDEMRLREHYSHVINWYDTLIIDDFKDLY